MAWDVLQNALVTIAENLIARVRDMVKSRKKL
jgi:hypothetical protein